MTYALTVRSPHHRARYSEETTWYFDTAEQAWRAVEASARAGVTIAEAERVAAVPAGDFITDADEFVNWLEGNE